MHGLAPAALAVTVYCVFSKIYKDCSLLQKLIYHVKRQIEFKQEEDLSSSGKWLVVASLQLAHALVEVMYIGVCGHMHWCLCTHFVRIFNKLHACL